MNNIVIAIGILILVFFIWSRFLGGWRILHQKMVGLLIIGYGAYLATLTGTVTHFVIPGIGSVGGGAVAGAGVGFVTWLVVGTVGVATGGVGIAIGAAAMTMIGGILGATGAATGGAGFTTVTYPLVSPFFGSPLYFLVFISLLGVEEKNPFRLKLPITQM